MSPHIFCSADTTPPFRRFNSTRISLSVPSSCGTKIS
nr:MAG TPA: hypothetical protein [Caudoviricetes sp.]